MKTLIERGAIVDLSRVGWWKWPRVRAIWLMGSEFSEEHVELLLLFEEVEFLVLVDADVEGDVALAYIAHLKELRHLCIVRAGAQDRSIEHLLSLEELAFIDISGNAFTAKALLRLGRLSQLAEVHAADLPHPGDLDIARRSLPHITFVRESFFYQ